MVKLYSRLHHTTNHFKKQVLRISLLLFVMQYAGTTINAQCPVVNVSPITSCGGVAGSGGPCTPLTASGNADTYTWLPVAGLYTDCQMTIPYAGTNLQTVYAAPTVHTVYTVTGTIISSGCSRTATASVNYTPPAPTVTPNPAVVCLGSTPIPLVAGTANAIPFCSAFLNISVPDNDPAGVSNSILVSGFQPGCNITGITVRINMPHTRIGNMVFVLKAPNGQIINLDYHLGATGGNGTGNFFNTFISSTGTTPLSAGTTPYTGTFKADLQMAPAGGFGAAGPTGMIPTTANWANLFTGTPNGNWTLGFYDGVSGDVGALQYWCLEISQSCGTVVPSTPAVWSPALGLFMDVTATIPYVAGTQTNVVWAKPLPAGIYTYAVTTQSLPGPLASFTNPAAISIPVGGTATPYSSNVTVSGLPVTTATRVRSVVLNGINHTMSNDLDILLQSPTGQNVILMSDVGGSNAINATYTFMDDGSFMS
ncbi:MAG TPA: hypothetical protein VHL77_02605, partial [Ferruginibacter sp.]|nr:hypothetical protein [Ferruginibacter sp.]